MTGAAVADLARVLPRYPAPDLRPDPGADGTGPGNTSSAAVLSEHPRHVAIPVGLKVPDQFFGRHFAGFDRFLERVQEQVLSGSRRPVSGREVPDGDGPIP